MSDRGSWHLILLVSVMGVTARLPIRRLRKSRRIRHRLSDYAVRHVGLAPPRDGQTEMGIGTEDGDVASDVG